MMIDDDCKLAYVASLGRGRRRDDEQEEEEAQVNTCDSMILDSPSGGRKFTGPTIITRFGYDSTVAWGSHGFGSIYDDVYSVCHPSTAAVP